MGGARVSDLSPAPDQTAAEERGRGAVEHRKIEGQAWLNESDLVCRGEHVQV